MAPLEPPFTPARYIELMQEAERAGYAVLIVDSLSHAWAGDGGILDMHDKAAAASRSGNGFAAWREVTPQHNALVDAMLGADLHIITTMRTKTAYEVVEDERGKKLPRKIGLAPVQRDGLEYEFTLVMDLSVDSHVATATKDRTRLFDGAHFVPARETGEALRAWLELARPRRGAGVPASGDAKTLSPSLPHWGRGRSPFPPAGGSWKGGLAGGRAEPLDGRSPHRGSDPSGSAAGSPLRLSGLGKDPAEESKRVLRRLKAAASKIETVPQLNAWWRQNAPEVAQLTPADAEKLKGHCALRKSRPSSPAVRSHPRATGRIPPASTP